MNYNKNLIELISDLSSLQAQLIFEDDKNQQTFTVKANDDKVTTCFILNAPKSYFDFTGDQIAFYDYTKFKKYFSIFDKPTKDPATSNVPKLDITPNKNGNGYTLNIQSSIDSRCFYTKLGDPHVVTKPQFDKIAMPSIDAELPLSEEDVINLKSMISTVSADTATFNCSGNVCKVTLCNNYSGDTFTMSFDLTTPTQNNFEIVIPKNGIVAMPVASYNIKMCSRGLIELTQIRDDDIKLTMYFTRKK